MRVSNPQISRRGTSHQSGVVSFTAMSKVATPNSHPDLLSYNRSAGPGHSQKSSVGHASGVLLYAAPSEGRQRRRTNSNLSLAASVPSPASSPTSSATSATPPSMRRRGRSRCDGRWRGGRVVDPCHDRRRIFLLLYDLLPNLTLSWFRVRVGIVLLFLFPLP